MNICAEYETDNEKKYDIERGSSRVADVPRKKPPGSILQNGAGVSERYERVIDEGILEKLEIGIEQNDKDGPCGMFSDCSFLLQSKKKGCRRPCLFQHV